MNENPAAPPESGPAPDGAPSYGPPHSTPSPPPGSAPSHHGTDSFFNGIRRSGVVRSDERWIGGVGGGIALRLGIDPLIVRGLLGVSVLLGGVGLVLYGVGWLLLPEQRDGRIHLQQLFRGDFDVAVLAAFAVLVTGLSFPDSWMPGLWWVGDAGWSTGLLWLGAVIVVVVLMTSSNRGQQPVPPSDPRAAPQPATPGSPATTAAASPRAKGPTTTLYPAPPVYPTPPAGHTPTQQYPTAQYPTQQHPTPQYPTAQYPTAQYPTAQYPTQGATGWSGPAGPVGPTGPVTSIPRSRSSRGPGGTAVGIVVALTLLTFAGLLYAERSDRFDGPVLLVTGAVALVLAGLGIIVSGLRGRSSGALGGLSVVTIIALLPLSALYQVNWTWDETGTSVGDVVETPSTVAAAEQGYNLGAGDALIDLTDVPLGGDPVEIPIRVGAGEVRIVMPADGAYSGMVQVFAGKVEWLGESNTRRGGSPRVYESAAVLDGAEPDLVLDVTVGAGRVTVVEE